MSFDEQIAMFLGRSPRVAVSAFIAPGAFVAGDVTIGEEASIWPGCSLRGDIAPIAIGAHSNIQDGSVVHVADDLPAVVGEWVTVGHKAIVHACEIGDEVLVGHGSNHLGRSQDRPALDYWRECHGHHAIADSAGVAGSRIACDNQTHTKRRGTGWDSKMGRALRGAVASLPGPLQGQ